MARKKRTIKSKITSFSILISGLGMLILTIAAAASISILSTNNANEAVLEVTKVAAEKTSWEVMAYSNIAAELGVNEILCDPSSSDAQKKDILTKRAEQYGLERCNYIDANGNGIDGNNYSDREYYKAAMEGRQLVSDPLVSKVTGKITIIIAAPLWKDGIANGTPIGCVYVVPDEEFLNDITRTIEYGDEGSAFMLSKDGVLIADRDSENVKKMMNFNDLGGTTAALTKRMTALETGCEKVNLLGNNVFVGYAPVPETNGWSLAVYGPVSEHLRGANITIAICVIILLVVATAAGILAAVMGKKIGDPITKCTDRILLLAEGDLSSNVPRIKSDDETQLLANATETVVNSLNSIIRDIGRIVGEMANGDLTVDTEIGSNLYIGDYSQLLGNLDLIKNNFRTTMDQITTQAHRLFHRAQPNRLPRSRTSPREYTISPSRSLPTPITAIRQESLSAPPQILSQPQTAI